MPGGVRKIEDFVVGDAVLAAGPDLTWREASVKFEGGTSPGKENVKTMKTVYYRLGDKDEALTVTPDHVFLQPGGKVRRAEKLLPGDHVLVAADGSHLPVLKTEVGEWSKGVHHISTGDDVATDLDGHLLNSGGVVSADWAVQMADIEGGALGDILATDWAEVPLSDRRYERLNASVPDFDPDPVRPDGFRPFTGRKVRVPEDARRFLRDAWMEDVARNAPRRPVSSSTGLEMVTNLFRLFEGFYPNIHFTYEPEDDTPNAYSFAEHSLKVVILLGGLVRVEALRYEGLALILAHEVGHLLGEEPRVPGTRYSCEGQSDYTAVSAVLRVVHFRPADYRAVVDKGIEQVGQLFGFVDPSNAGGQPSDTCSGLSVQCRLDCMLAGLHTLELPECRRPGAGPTGGQWRVNQPG